jgi:hypothetical protein
VRGWKEATLAACVFTVVGVAAAAPSADAAEGGEQSSRSVTRLAPTGRVSDAVRREVAGVRSERDVAPLSVRARRRVTTPVVEVTEYRKVLERATYGSGSGKVGRGCYRVWVKRTRRNVFGWVLMTAQTTIRNWCNNGRTITSQPTVVRTQNAHWGWSSCGWVSEYSGWLRSRTRFGAGGYARYAYADSCFTAQMRLRNELQVQGDGRWFWWN